MDIPCCWVGAAHCWNVGRGRCGKDTWTLFMEVRGLIYPHAHISRSHITLTLTLSHALTSPHAHTHAHSYVLTLPYKHPHIPHIHIPHSHLHTLTPPQLPDKHGITAILAAIYEGHEDCVKLLVDKVTSRSMRGNFCVRTLFCGTLKTHCPMTWALCSMCRVLAGMGRRLTGCPTLTVLRVRKSRHYSDKQVCISYWLMWPIMYHS